MLSVVQLKCQIVLGMWMRLYEVWLGDAELVTRQSSPISSWRKVWVSKKCWRKKTGHCLLNRQ